MYICMYDYIVVVVVKSVSEDNVPIVLPPCVPMWLLNNCTHMCLFSYTHLTARASGLLVSVSKGCCSSEWDLAALKLLMS